MEKTHSKKRDYSLLFMTVVIVAAFLLTGCNLTNTDSTASSAPTSAGETKVATISKIIPEARADYEEGEFQLYSEAAYKKAIGDNKKVFLDFHANWCAVCVGNAPVIEEAFDTSFMDNVVGFKVDYDKEKSLEAELGVSSQATLILFQGSDELGRVMGPQTPESLAEFILLK